MTLRSTLKIRNADASDAADLAKLIDIAGEGIPTWLWSQNCIEGQLPLHIGEERARRESGGFSYKNARVAEEGGTVAGMVLSYPITDTSTDNPDDFPDPIAPFVELETQSAATWYINALAVFAGRRGDGIGSQLLNDAETQALSAGYTMMSIQVYGQNTGAYALYTRCGYKLKARAKVRHHPCQPYYTGDVLLLFKSLQP